MSTKLSILSVVVLLLVAGCGAPQARPLAPTDDPMLAHNVLFTLKDDLKGDSKAAEAAKQKLTDSCYDLLADIPGIVFFAAGPRARDFLRPVNMLNFDVGLHIVFENKKAHDEYQKAEKHLQFIKQNKGTLKKVRAYDTYVR
jgi:hypothetical protein